MASVQGTGSGGLAIRRPIDTPLADDPMPDRAEEIACIHSIEGEDHDHDHDDGPWPSYLVYAVMPDADPVAVAKVLLDCQLLGAVPQFRWGANDEIVARDYEEPFEVDERAFEQHLQVVSLDRSRRRGEGTCPLPGWGAKLEMFAIFRVLASMLCGIGDRPDRRPWVSMYMVADGMIAEFSVLAHPVPVMAGIACCEDEECAGEGECWACHRAEVAAELKALTDSLPALIRGKGMVLADEFVARYRAGFRAVLAEGRAGPLLIPELAVLALDYLVPALDRPHPISDPLEPSECELVYETMQDELFQKKAAAKRALVELRERITQTPRGAGRQRLAFMIEINQLRPGGDLTGAEIDDLRTLVRGHFAPHLTPPVRRTEKQLAALARAETLADNAARWGPAVRRSRGAMPADPAVHRSG